MPVRRPAGCTRPGAWRAGLAVRQRMAIEPRVVVRPGGCAGTMDHGKV